jgi:hypothetical protein
MMLRSQDEKEIKVELMMTFFLGVLNDKIDQTNKEGIRNIEKYTNFLMSICSDQILTI